ncbi:MAG TPA: bifunctional precorrin-2 dehydrogenase/sirohydrochlorin ferrochelatase [Dehalococcoidia bacterium]|nr:bifunctional precorrin-2 dehydrogenase/sirohydrochlorin ferrochelatase [Dehalococcoidia bacterium]
MARYYPIYLDLRGRPCLVIGGDREALRKALGLLESEARVTLIAQKTVRDLAVLADDGRITWQQRAYREGDLQGVFLAIASPEVSGQFEAIYQEALARGVLVNCMDDPARCVWIAPSIIRRGDVTIAMSTGGRSPAYARWLRANLEEVLPEEFLALGELMIELRDEFRRKRLQVSDAERWQIPRDHEVVGLLGEGKREEAKAAFRAWLLAPD